MKKFLVTLSILVAVCGVIHAQTQAEINAAIQAAKQYGYTDSEINGFLNHQSGQTVVVEPAASTGAVSREAIREVVGDAHIIQEAPKATSSDVFGHSIFSSKYLNFVPSYNIPTPQNYIIAPGDELIVEMWGASAQTVSLSVTPEGTVTVPNVGPVYLVGETIQSAQDVLKRSFSAVQEDLNDGTTQMRLSLGKLRSVSVNIVGDVTVPGTYTMPSLGTLCSALYLAGGVSQLGTVRDIKLYRKGKEILSFDVYDFILNGKFENNERLEDNDLIIVGSYDKIVAINGNVKRQLRFELKGSQTIADVIEYAGGFTSNAYREKVSVTRVIGDKHKAYTVEKGEFASFVLEDGDVITVTANSGRFENKVSINGTVYFAGDYSLDNCGTLSQLIEAAGGLREEAYRKQAFIYRKDSEYQPVAVSVNLESVLNGTNDVALMREDVVRIFSLDDINLNSTIQVIGNVNSPGTYEWRPGITLGDALLLSNGFNRSATIARVEIARRNQNTNSLEPSDTLATIINVNLVQDTVLVNLDLEPFDIVMVRQAPNYKEQQVITVHGQVVFPGSHVVESDEVRLSDVIKKAGGFLNKAYIHGSRLTRTLNTQEVERIRLASEIANEKLKAKGDTLYIDPAKLGTSYDIAINMEAAIANPYSDADIVLREGDIITVPKMDNTVKVSGGVLLPHSVTYNGKYGWKDYVGMSGGFVKRALKKRAYFVYMNGGVSTRRYGIFRAEPGCELVIPERSTNAQPRFGLGEALSTTTSLTTLAAMMVYLFK